MATEHATVPVNGYAAQSASPAPSQPQQSSEVTKEQIGWYFVERYYNTLSKSPESLYLLYNKRSQFVAGVEEEKVQVCIGLKAIKERVQELDYQNCKVRVTNVDSQSSDINIVVQVLGEMSNGTQPDRKFVQTFVLAPQPQGYFLLNDILRFLEEDVPPYDAPEEAQPEPVDAAPAEADVQPAPSEEVVVDDAAKEVEEPVETAPKVEAKPVNGTSEKAIEPEETLAEPSVTEEEKPEETEEEEEEEEETVEDEKPVEPAPTPAVAKPAQKPAPVQNKPAVPLSWAQRIGANSVPRAAAPAASPAASASSSAAAAPKAAATPATPSTSAQPAAAAPVSTPARQPSPTDSNQDGSNGGWQTAGAEHSRNKSRSQPGPNLTENGHVRAYVKNVFATVKAEDLKAELSKHGELAYFDVNRQKNSAFVEFATVAGFNAAVAANPHKINGDNIYVEERRVTTTFNARGGARGGRGAFEGRPNQSRGGGFGQTKPEGGAPRGGFNGNRGRGGPVANRGRTAQA